MRCTFRPCVQEPLCGLRILSSARTCEVYHLAAAGGGAQYVCTLRGELHNPPSRQQRGPGPAYEITHTARLPPGLKIRLRLLSLADRGRLELLSLAALPLALPGVQGGVGGGAAPALEERGTQMDQVRSMLEGLVGGGGGGDPGAPPDPKLALLQSLARAALAPVGGALGPASTGWANAGGPAAGGSSSTVEAAAAASSSGAAPPPPGAVEPARQLQALAAAQQAQQAQQAEILVLLRQQAATLASLDLRLSRVESAAGAVRKLLEQQAQQHA